MMFAALRLRGHFNGSRKRTLERAATGAAHQLFTLEVWQCLQGLGEPQRMVCGGSFPHSLLRTSKFTLVSAIMEVDDRRLPHNESSLPEPSCQLL